MSNGTGCGKILVRPLRPVKRRSPSRTIYRARREEQPAAVHRLYRKHCMPLTSAQLKRGRTLNRWRQYPKSRAGTGGAGESRTRDTQFRNRIVSIYPVCFQSPSVTAVLPLSPVDRATQFATIGTDKRKMELRHSKFEPSPPIHRLYSWRCLTYSSNWAKRMRRVHPVPNAERFLLGLWRMFLGEKSCESIESQRAALHHTHLERPFDHSTWHSLQKQSEPAKSSVHRNEPNTEFESEQGGTWRSSNPRLCQFIFLREKSNVVQAGIHA